MPNNKLNPARAGESLGRWLPETHREPVLVCVTWMPASRHPCQVASTDCHQSQNTPDLICTLWHMANQSAFQPSSPHNVAKRGKESNYTLKPWPMVTDSHCLNCHSTYYLWPLKGWNRLWWTSHWKSTKY